MKNRTNLFGRRAQRPMHASMVIALGFVLIILAGAVLLTLPVSSRSGGATGFLDALFTATSATCVTGLVTVGTATHWSGFGQAVILLLIQIGGLGFMTLASVASFLTRRTITLRERMVMSAGMNLSANAGIVRLTRRVLFGTLLFEAAGAVLLACRFVPQFGLARGVWMGVFHAVSAFCNAGFDLLGTPDSPFSSLTGYVGDPVVNLTIMALIVIGGLGFFVWGDIWGQAVPAPAQPAHQAGAGDDRAAARWGLCADAGIRVEQPRDARRAAYGRQAACGGVPVGDAAHGGL